MNKVKKTYIILWSLFLLISLILIFTLPSIWTYYNGFSSETLKSLGVSNEAMATLTKSLNIVDGILPKSLGVGGIVKVASSYITGYVPADFPENNLPVKFWGAVVFLLFSYGFNLWTVMNAIKNTKTNEDAFFNIPIVAQSIVCLLASIAVSLYMVINDKIYYVMAVIIYILLIIIMIIIYNGTDLLKSHIKGIDEENKTNKFFIDDLKTKCELLINKIKDDNSKKLINKLLEEAKYSISISNDKAKNVETNINYIMEEISKKIETNENENITNEINKVLSLLKDRNILAKK